MLINLACASTLNIENLIKYFMKTLCFYKKLTLQLVQLSVLTIFTRARIVLNTFYKINYFLDLININHKYYFCKIK